MAKQQLVNSSTVMSAIALIIASPILLVVALFSGIFNAAIMIQTVSNVWVIGVVLLLNAVFYAANKTSTMTIIYTGVGTGLIFWLMSLIAIFNNIGSLCNIPILGQLICGGITLASVFTSLLGYVLGGLIISLLIGGFFLLLSKNKK